MPPVRHLFPALLVLAAVPGAAQAPQETVPGASIDVLSYKVEIGPDFGRKSLAGKERISFRSLLDGVREIAFSDNALEIAGAALDGRPVTVTRRAGAFVFAFPRPLRRGQSATLQLSFRGQPKRGVSLADNSVPLAFAGAYPSLGARRALQYSKGALFLDHLRTEVGDRASWAGLKTFTRTHAGGAVESRDFQRALETSSGRDLSALFDEWVYP